jgi:hypothetical protein
MGNGPIGLATAMALASTMASAGYASKASSGGAKRTGGSSSNRGTGGGTLSNGGQAGGGASGGSSVTSFSGTKALNALATAEAAQLCGETIPLHVTHHKCPDLSLPNLFNKEPHGSVVPPLADFAAEQSRPAGVGRSRHLLRGRPPGAECCCHKRTGVRGKICT